MLNIDDYIIDWLFDTRQSVNRLRAPDVQHTLRNSYTACPSIPHYVSIKIDIFEKNNSFIRISTNKVSSRGPLLEVRPISVQHPKFTCLSNPIKINPSDLQELFAANSIKSWTLLPLEAENFFSRLMRIGSKGPFLSHSITLCLSFSQSFHKFYVISIRCLESKSYDITVCRFKMWIIRWLNKFNSP